MAKKKTKQKSPTAAAVERGLQEVEAAVVEQPPAPPRKRIWTWIDEEDLLQIRKPSALHERAKHLLEEQNTGNWDKYLEGAREAYHRDGEIEIEDDATVSYSEDKGAYVLAWVWIYDVDCGIKTADDDDPPITYTADYEALNDSQKVTVQRLLDQPLGEGMMRAVHQCQDNGCRKIQAYDYIPFGIGRGGPWYNQCIHSIAQNVGNWLNRAKELATRTR